MMGDKAAEDKAVGGKRLGDNIVERVAEVRETEWWDTR